jgi:hypothetical protein
VLAIVRNCRATIRGVESFEMREGGRLHLVHIEYADTDSVAEGFFIRKREWGVRCTVMPKASERIE